MNAQLHLWTRGGQAVLLVPVIKCTPAKFSSQKKPETYFRQNIRAYVPLVKHESPALSIVLSMAQRSTSDIPETMSVFLASFSNQRKNIPGGKNCYKDSAGIYFEPSAGAAIFPCNGSGTVGSGKRYERRIGA